MPRLERPSDCPVGETCVAKWRGSSLEHAGGICRGGEGPDVYYDIVVIDGGASWRDMPSQCVAPGPPPLKQGLLVSKAHSEVYMTRVEIPIR